jgi:hypothetical protein
MNKNHPLDEVFRGKLRDFEAEAPMHLWEQVSQKRNRKHRFVNKMKQQKPLAALAGALIVTGIAWGVFSSQEVELNSFPLPMTSAHVIAAHDVSTAAESQSELVPDPTHKSKETTAVIRTAAAPHTAAAALNSVFNQPEYADRVHIQQYQPQSSQTTATADVATPSASNQASLVRTATQQLAANTPSIKPSKENIPQPLLSPLEKHNEQKHFTTLEHQSVSAHASSPQCVDFSKHEWTFYVDALASPDYVYNNIRANAPELEDYAKSRRETEKYQYAFSGAIRLSMVADNGLVFRTGINYSQINEKFTYFNGTEVTTTTTDVFDDQGNIIGVDTLVEIGTRYKVTHNKYCMLDIPFLVGYEFNTRKLNISVNGGAYLNLMFRQQGDLLSPSLQPIDLENEPVFKQQAGVGWYGSVGIAYEIASGLELIAEPHIKYYPNSVTQDQLGVQQHLSSAGLFLGVRKRL